MKKAQNIRQKLSNAIFLKKEYQDFHSPYTAEQLVLKMLKQGDNSVIMYEYERFINDSESKLSYNELRRKKYRFVASVTLYTRILIEKGLDSETAYTLSDLMINEVDQCKTIDEVNAMFYKMLSYYVEKIDSLNPAAPFSPTVKAAVQYISLHLHEKISLTDLCSELNISKAYFSTLFKEEVGCSPHNYILKCRIEESKDILKFTDMSYLDISISFCFSSLSHYIATFKKFVGITPKEYRCLERNNSH